MSSQVIEELRAAMASEGLDAVVTMSPANTAYSLGFVVPSLPLMRWRHVAHVVCGDGREAVVCVDMEESTVRAANPRAQVHSWSEFSGDAMRTLAEVLEALGLSRARVGVELGYLAVADHRSLVAAAPDVDLIAADDLLIATRRVKTQAEVDLLARLSAISDTAIQTSFESVRAGDTEMDIAAALTRSVYEQGAQDFKLMIVATGERSQLPNVGPTGRVLRPGDVCRVEIFSVIDGYQAGVCRTAVVGEASEDALRIYQVLSDCKKQVLDVLRPGIAASEVYRAYRARFDELGLDPIAFVGHSIGVDLHEAPYLGPHTDDVLREGMVLGMEPLAYRTGHGFGMQIKDMVAIEAGGARLLSDVTDTTELFRIRA